jgi:hypothetical protein
MDDDDLLDYALNRLDGPRREQLDHELASNPALASRLNRLIRNLARLLDDGQGPPAPTSASVPTPLPRAEPEPGPSPQ